MPSAIKGTLIECDPSIRALILMMDTTAGSIVLEELDETHLFVDSGKVDYIKNELSRRLAQHNYNPDDDDD